MTEVDKSLYGDIASPTVSSVWSVLLSSAACSRSGCLPVASFSHSSSPNRACHIVLFLPNNDPFLCLQLSGQTRRRHLKYPGDVTLRSHISPTNGRYCKSVPSRESGKSCCCLLNVFYTRTSGEEKKSGFIADQRPSSKSWLVVIQIVLLVMVKYVIHAAITFYLSWNIQSISFHFRFRNTDIVEMCPEHC